MRNATPSAAGDFGPRAPIRAVAGAETSIGPGFLPVDAGRAPTRAAAGAEASIGSGFLPVDAGRAPIRAASGAETGPEIPRRGCPGAIAGPPQTS